MRKAILTLACLLLATAMHAQKGRLITTDGRSADRTSTGTSAQQSGNRFEWGRDSTHNKTTELPMGVTQWTITPLLGEIVPQAEVDTLMKDFQLVNNHDGLTGQYNHTGAHGSPRQSRIYLDRPATASPFFFLDSYDYFRPDLSTFRFSNTRCPITNLSYHRAGSSSQGNDRVKAYFASNINKLAGYGFQLDYLYSRGLYNFQQNSMFNGTLYGYHHGERYQMHAWFSANHAKMAENGGITDDDYIKRPESFERSFTERDIPTQMSDTWNRNDDQTYYLSHRFNMGYTRRMEVPDSLLPKIPADDELLRAAFQDSLIKEIKADSVRLAATLDTLRTKAEAQLVYPEEFIPVASIIHTFRTQRMRHAYSAHRMQTNADYYATPYEGGQDLNDKTNALQIHNNLALSLREGFRPWVKAGLTAFVGHQYTRYTLPDSADYRENDIYCGATMARTSGRALHFNATAQLYLIGEHAGDLSVDGNIRTQFPLLRDTCALSARAYLRNDKPNFFFRHYHSTFATWDKTFDQEVRTHIEGTLSMQRTRTHLTVGVDNITNYTHLATTLTPNPDNSVNPWRHAVAPVQASGSIQVLTAQLRQDFKFGILHWENQLTYQKSSRQDILPLPAFNLWTNLYIHFQIAKVLNIDLGADTRYFTRYTMPDYTPVLNTFATQDQQHAIKLGNYPITTVYLNANLKHFRVYAAMHNLCATFMQGDSFLAPHYPIDPMMLHFGLSWNFFN